MTRALAAGVVVAVAAAIAVVVVVTRPDAPKTPRDDPRAFAESVVRQISANRYAAAWETLNPVDQKVAPRDEYVECEQRTPIDADIRHVRALSVRDESVGLGNGRFIASKAVEVRITLGDRSSFVAANPVHVVADGARWTWILPSWRYRAFRANHCPTAPSAAAESS